MAFITLCLSLADEAQLLVAATVREEDLGESHALAGWIVRLRATGLLTEISLSPLEAADTARLAEAIAGQRLPEAGTGLLHAATGGFPLYVIEAVRGTTDPVGTPLPPGDLAAVLRKRLDQGTAVAREVADLAAAAGTNFTLDLLTEADPESELAGQAHAIAGFSAFSLGMPADGLRHLELAARLARRCRLAEFRHPSRCAREGLCCARPLAARPPGRSAGRLP